MQQGGSGVFLYLCVGGRWSLRSVFLRAKEQLKKNEGRFRKIVGRNLENKGRNLENMRENLRNRGDFKRKWRER